MITISTLQSQIALNRNIIGYLEAYNKCAKQEIVKVKDCNNFFQAQAGTSFVELEELYSFMASRSKQIKQYAKLQRALKSELAYRIMYNREMRSNNMDGYQLK